MANKERPADISRRVSATLIDYTLVFALTIFFIIMAGTKDEEGTYTISGWPVFIPMLFWFLYFVIAEYYLEGTMGHLIFKLKVVSIAGRKATFSQVFVRRICDVLEISWCFGLVAYLIARNTPNHQRLGDLVAKTMVVDYAFMPDDVTFDFEEPLHENAERRKTINPYL